MNIFSGKCRVFLLMLLVGTLFTAWNAYSQEEPPAEAGGAAEPPPDPNAWKKQREEIFREIAKEADKRARATWPKEKVVAIVNTYAAKFEDEVRKEENRYRRKFIATEQNKWRSMDDMPDEYPDMSKYLDISIPEWKVRTSVQKDMRKIRDDMEAELAKIFENACKQRNIDDLEREGQAKYPMYKLEDGKKKPYVRDVTLRGGRGYAATRIEGRLEVVTVNRIKIGHRMISRNDLDEETQALFYDEVNQKMVEKYVLREQRRYKAIKEGFINDWIAMTYPDMLMAEGYVPKEYMLRKKMTENKNQRNSTNTQNWVQRNAYLDRVHQMRVKMEIERITPDITKEFFENAVEKFSEKIGCDDDYEFVKEAGDPPGTGEWMPKNVAEAFRNNMNQNEGEAKPEGEAAPAP